VRIPKLIIAERLLALRWPGAIGALLLAAGAGYAALVLVPTRDRLAADEVKVARAERKAAAVRSGLEAAPLSPAQRRERFFNALPATTEVTQSVERIYAAAAAEKLSLMHGEYTGADLPAAGIVRYKITLPLKGSYPQVRRFIAEALKTVPGLTLDDVALQRQKIDETQVEARVQLSLFLARR
jgi:Tfp pilus assembly protein PilO